MQATRLRKGMLVKVGENLLRVLELQHVTPGNLRGFVRVKFRNIRSGALADQKLGDEVGHPALDWEDRPAVLEDSGESGLVFAICSNPACVVA
jgi:elongation factor P